MTTKSSTVCALTMVILFAMATAVHAATPEQVDAAVDRAVTFLLKSQTGDNGVNWEDPDQASRGFHGGVTACAVYALLAAGETPQKSPKLATAIDWLAKQEMLNTYAVAMRCQVWHMLADRKDPAIVGAMKRDAKTLLEGTRKNGQGFRGNWSYLPTSKVYDNSCSQYGLLGLWALEQRGLEFSDDLWKAVEQHWIKTQHPDGTWAYNERERTRLSMIAAGVASLFITQDYLHRMDGIRCGGNPDNVPLRKGMKALADLLPKTKVIDLYTWYGIERIGVASGHKYIGAIDWYKTGAEALVKSQGKDGEWMFGIGMSLKSGKIAASVRTVGTSFGILFLTRGRAPVVINKLEYAVGEKEGNWNQRPRDVGNAVKYMMRQMERDLNWQIVNLNVHGAELHDAPILYISGNQTLKFSQAEEEKLRTFVHQGGLLLGHADCSDARFAKSFKELGAKLFSNYEFRKLPGDHPIYSRQVFMAKNWKNKPDVESLSNGVRELMILLPTGDPARAWQLRDERTKEESFQLISNIVLFAVEGRDLRSKGDSHIVIAKQTPRVTRKVARIKVGDNWDPEPGGWKRLSALMTNTQATAIETTAVRPAGDELRRFKIAHLTGTAKFTLNAEEQKAIKQFIEGGGTLLIDAAGGSHGFAESAESALRELFHDDARQLDVALPGDHPLYSAGGEKLKDVTFRSFARAAIPAGTKTPLLRGIVMNGRLAVIYSREDVSAGLVGQSVDGILGYSPGSATDLMCRMIAFASKEAAAASSKPASGVRQ